MKQPEQIDPTEAIRQMEAAAEVRSSPPVDSTRINRAKHLFLECARKVCPRYEIREDQKSILNEIVHWSLMDYYGKLDPDRGLLLWGDIGTGKSTLLHIIREFCRLVRPYDNGFPYSFRITNVIDICAEFADESRNGGYTALHGYIVSKRQAFDELGSETTPTGRWGNYENVMQYILQRRYDLRDGCFTHATTNLSLDQIAEVYSARIYDRCKELFNFVEIHGKTFRKIYQTRNDYEQEKDG